MIYQIVSIFITRLAKMMPWISEMNVHTRVKSETKDAKSN
jgi:hypothetical protein